jgi:hypothetical protein
MSLALPHGIRLRLALVCALTTLLELQSRRPSLLTNVIELQAVIRNNTECTIRACMVRTIAIQQTISRYGKFCSVASLG